MRDRYRINYDRNQWLCHISNRPGYVYGVGKTPQEALQKALEAAALVDAKRGVDE